MLFLCKFEVTIFTVATLWVLKGLPGRLMFGGFVLCALITNPVLVVTVTNDTYQYATWALLKANTFKMFTWLRQLKWTWEALYGDVSIVIHPWRCSFTNEHQILIP